MTFKDLQIHRKPKYVLAKIDKVSETHKLSIFQIKLNLQLDLYNIFQQYAKVFKTIIQNIINLKAN